MVSKGKIALSFTTASVGAVVLTNWILGNQGFWSLGCLVLTVAFACLAYRLSWNMLSVLMRDMTDFEYCEGEEGYQRPPARLGVKGTLIADAVFYFAFGVPLILLGT